MTNLPDKNSDPLRKILNHEMLEQPSVNFTGSVMNSLGLAPAISTIKYEPVITLRGWILISIIFITICLLGLFGGNNSGGFAGLERFGETISYSTSLFLNLVTSPFALILSVSAFAIMLLFAADGWYRHSRLHVT